MATITTAKPSYTITRLSRQLSKTAGLPRLRPKFWVGGGLLASILLAIAFTPWLTPYDPTEMLVQNRMAAPSWEHPFGTDFFGRDMLSRVLYGARITLRIAFGATLIGATAGVVIGALMGLLGGRLDRLVTQLMDAWIALPSVLLALVVVSIWGRGEIVLLVALGVTGIPNVYRLTRAETMRATVHEYVDAATAMGASRRHILLRHVLPQILPVLSVVVALYAARLLVTVSSLSFIGLGIAPPEPEWGALLADGRQYMHNAWWLMFFPGLAIVICVYTINTLSDGLRDWFDPFNRTGSV